MSVDIADQWQSPGSLKHQDLSSTPNLYVPISVLRFIIGTVSDTQYISRHHGCIGSKVYRLEILNPSSEVIDHYNIMYYHLLLCTIIMKHFLKLHHIENTTHITIGSGSILPDTL